MVNLKHDQIGRFAVTYCCRMDQNYTLEGDTADLGRLFGYTPEEIEGKFQNSLLQLAEHETGEDIHKTLNGLSDGQDEVEAVWAIRHKNGSVVWVMNRACRVTAEDDREYLVGILVDVTRSKLNYDAERMKTCALQEQVQRDSLTQIYNAQTARKLTEEYLAEAGERLECALLIIDLDNFKQVNDIYGHMVGDEVLVQAAGTIRRLFRSQDIVGRIGGDEFLVLMKDTADRGIVNLRCQQMRQAFQTILQGKKVTVAVSCSVGVSFAPGQGSTYNELFCHADQALYYAKGLGKDRYAFYDPQMCGLRDGNDAGKET